MSAIRLSAKGGIARKLAGLVLAALAASFLVTASVSTWLDLRRQAALETNRLTQTARVIGSLASDAVVQGDRGQSFVAIRSVSQMPGITYARLESDTAGFLAETGAGARLTSDATVDGHDQAGLSIWSLLNTGSIRVTAPVMSEGARVGSITLFGQTPELRARALSTLWTTLLGALVAVVAGMLVAMRMARQISAPIVALAERMRRVEDAGDVVSMSDIKAEGEVADLVAGFDTMMAGIRERDARIVAHVEGLEGEVAARTGELVVARDAAEKANAAKSDFLAVMSHEIRTPLNGILALSDMLATSDLPARQQRYADVISKSGKSLLGIINDILDFSKVEAGKMELEIVETDLAEAAEDVASLFAEKAASKGLDLAVFVDPRLPLVFADPTRLRQVIGNLVNNAIKFTETGGVLISIDRDPARPDQVRIAVRDTGPGIPAETLPLLFKAFTQADQSTTRKYGGTGLGLAICDRLIQAMGGAWDLSSVVGEGSVFAFSAPFRFAAEPVGDADLQAGWTVAVRDLPSQTRRAVLSYLSAWGLAASDGRDGSKTGPMITSAMITSAGAPLPSLGVVICDNEDEAAALAQRAPSACGLVKPIRREDLRSVLAQMQRGQSPRLTYQRNSGAAGATFPGVRVLVVDDSEVNREVAVEALSRLRVEAITANDGQEAVDALRSGSFDLVLMDGSMPVLDGFEATRIIRAEEDATGRPRAAIVALTAHVVGSGAEAWKAAGMDGVIHKPFSIGDLVRELMRFCPDRAAASANPIAEPTAEAPTEAIGVRADLFDVAVRGDLLAMRQAGRADFVDRVHALYAANAPDRVAEIVEGASAGDADTMARAAHALKSMSLSLGASAVAAEASRIETAARSGQTASMIEIGQVRSLVEATMHAMSAPDATPEVGPSAEEALAAGIERGELHLVYQPLVERKGQLSGKVEALVRWVHPEHGRISPDDFVPGLEADGGIARLTDFVMHRAMEDLKDHPRIRVSINASASEFQQPGFAARVLAASRRQGFPPERLEIEVTETAMLDVEAARRTIDSLKASGFDVALDDFGAGFTSLHALRELKFTTLKVDRSFVDRCTSDNASAAIIHAVIGVGRALGMKVVCEGVETADQADFLRIAGAHYLQGYHFHRPLELHDLLGVEDRAA